MAKKLLELNTGFIMTIQNADKPGKNQVLIVHRHQNVSFMGQMDCLKGA